MSGSTNSKIKGQNKAIEKQYKYDRQMYNWQNQQNQNNYEHALDVRKINQGNAQQAVDYQNQTAMQNWKYQSDIQQYRYDNEVNAYNQSLKDYDNQVQLNSAFAAVSKEAENRKLEESIISANFDRQDAAFAKNKALSALNYESNEASRTLGTAKKNTALDKQQIGVNTATAQGQYQIKTAQSEYDLKKNASDLDILNERNDQAMEYAAKEQQNRNAALDIQDAFNAFKAGKDTFKLDLQNRQYEIDKQFVKDKQGWETDQNNLNYNKAQAANMNERMEAMVKKSRALGQARAAGREGASAESQQQSILAEYGRNQAKLVDTLVFAQDAKAIQQRQIDATAQNQTDKLNTAISINNTDKDLIAGTLDKDNMMSLNKRLANQIVVDKINDAANLNKKEGFIESVYKDATIRNRMKSDKLSLQTTLATQAIAKSKLETALEDTRQRIENLNKRIQDDVGFTNEQYNLSMQKIKASEESARKAYQASMQRIDLQEYAANLQAQGNIRSKPTYPPSIPVPKSIPVTAFPMPTAPKKPPKPVKGTLQKTSVWNDVGDVFNAGLQITSAVAPFF